MLLIGIEDASGMEKLRARLRFTTPPAAVQITRLDPLSKEFAPFLKLTFPNDRLDLMLVYELNNLEKQPVEITLPVKINARVERQMDQYNTRKEAPCVWRTEEKHWNDVFPGAQYLFALDQNLSGNIFQQRTHSQQRFILLPGAKKIFGLFVSNEAIRNFLDRGLPQSDMQTFVVHVYCYPRDNGPIDSDFEERKHGTERGPVLLNVEEKSLQIEVRYPYSPNTSDPAVRTFPFMENPLQIL